MFGVKIPFPLIKVLRDQREKLQVSSSYKKDVELYAVDSKVLLERLTKFAGSSRIDMTLEELFPMFSQR